LDTIRLVGHTTEVGGRLDVRLNDAERQTAVVRLRDGYADGRLSIDELHQRLDVVDTASTRGDLVAITADLPRHRAPRGRDTRRVRVPFLEVNAVLWGIWSAQELFDGGAGRHPWPS